MTELVPFQEKRGKRFKENVTSQQAIELELTKYFANNYPTLKFEGGELEISKDAAVLDQQQITELPNITSFSFTIALVTSPTLIADETIPWTLSRLESPMLLMRLVAKGNTKSPYLVLPKPYQKMIKRVYTNALTFDKLAAFLKSKKRAKKYLRIFQKRLGIYSTRKPPFTKASAVAPRSAAPQRKSS